jgi:hypothetical protein
MKRFSVIKLLIVFAVSISFASLPGFLSNGFVLPAIPLAHANAAPAQAWWPAGPEMNTELAPIFSSETAEFTALQAGTVDLTDWPLTPTLISSLGSSSSYYVTSPISATDLFELQFMEATSFWGCNFNYGLPLSAPVNGLSVNCGQFARQGIAHLIDRSTSANSFTNTEPEIKGVSVPVDTSVPQSNGLPAPNPCSWDTNNPAETGTGCTVVNGGAYPAGGKAYNIAGSNGLNCGTETSPTACTFPYQQGFGSSDFCAAANDFIAAGFATGKDSHCVLTGINSIVTTDPVNLFARVDNPPRDDAGIAYFEGMCALFTGSFSSGSLTCGVSPSTNNIASITHGYITSFSGFTTSPTSVSQSWQIYTGGYNGVFPFTVALYNSYNSDVASASCTAPGTTGCATQAVGGGTCYNASVGSFAAGDYQYICNPTYDSISNQVEFGICPSAPGDPTPGQTDAQVTLAACPSAGLGTNDYAISSGSTYSGIVVPSGGLTDKVPIIFTALGTFTGSSTSLTATSSSPSTVSASLSASSVTLGTWPSSYQSLTLTIGLASNAATSATITISATIGGVTHTLTIGVSVAGGLYSLDGLRSVLSSASAGFIAEQLFDSNAYTIPLWVDKSQFGYSSIYNTGVINNSGAGIPQFNTWLNAYTATPNVNCPGTSTNCFIQGFKESTHSLSPYIANTVWDFFVIGNIYDSLHISNPSAPTQSIDYMTVSTKGPLTNSQLTYVPPAGTTATYSFTLRNDMFWQDGTKVTSWDVAFSDLTLKALGAFQAAGLSAMVGVTVHGPTQFDINLNANGPFTLLDITGQSIIPGELWSTCGTSTWNTDVASGSVPTSCYTVPSADSGPTFDPTCPSNAVGAGNVCTVKGILMGSSAWECLASNGELGTSCTTTGLQNPPFGDSYTLQRFGTGFAPGSSLTGSYFRSNGNLALSIWSGDVGDFTHDFLNFGVVAACFGKAVTGGTTGCGHWQEGIGGDVGGVAQPVGTIQAGIVSRFAGVNPVAPYNWYSYTVGTTTVPANPPTNLVAFPPTLHEGTATLTPAATALCTSAYPVGGYDC